MKRSCYFFLIIIISGCTTITQGMRDEVMFTSDQDSVEVWVSGRRIEYTPTSAELGKMTKKEATFIFPGGQEYNYVLATHLSPTVLYNLVLLFNPTLTATCAAVDMLGGAGRSFDDKTIRLTDKKTGKKVTIGIENIQKIPEHYILVSAGLGYGLIHRIEEKNPIYIAEGYFELIRSHRDIIHYGIGYNPSYFKEKDRAEVVRASIYFLFKIAPRIDNSPRRVYFIGQIGGGHFWTKFDPDEQFADSYGFVALGLGMGFSEKVYAELLFNGSFFKECAKFPDSSLGFHVGYRLNL